MLSDSPSSIAFQKTFWNPSFPLTLNPSPTRGEGLAGRRLPLSPRSSGRGGRGVRANLRKIPKRFLTIYSSSAIYAIQNGWGTTQPVNANMSANR